MHTAGLIVGLILGIVIALIYLGIRLTMNTKAWGSVRRKPGLTPEQRRKQDDLSRRMDHLYEDEDFDK